GGGQPRGGCRPPVLLSRIVAAIQPAVQIVDALEVRAAAVHELGRPWADQCAGAQVVQMGESRLGAVARPRGTSIPARIPRFNGRESTGVPRMGYWSRAELPPLVCYSPF